MLHPCITTARPYVATQLLLQPIPMRWGLETLPIAALTKGFAGCFGNPAK